MGDLATVLHETSPGGWSGNMHLDACRKGIHPMSGSLSGADAMEAGEAAESAGEQP